MSILSIASNTRLRSGYEIPCLGFGVALISNGAPVLEAVRAGYRHFDSAQHYNNEAAVGQALRESGVPRAEIFITTKVRPGTENYESAAASIEESVKTLGLDYVDLFLIHDPKGGAAVRIAKYRALLDAQKTGRVRTIGVSNFDVKHLEEIRAVGLEMPAVNHIELHPFNQQRPIVEYCRQHGIVVAAFCPLVRGKMDEPALVDIAKKHDREPAQVLVRWSLQKGFIPLPKSATPARIRSNADVFGFELAPEDMAALDALDQGKAGSCSWNPVDAD